MNRRIEDQLHGNGNLIEAARRATKSLSRPDRQIILRVRDRAIVAGFTDAGINALEMEGERGIRGFKAFPIEAHFIGKMGWLRLYNIEGDHRLKGSTVGVSTLLHNRIMPIDLSFFGIVFEFIKEQIFMAYVGAGIFLKKERSWL